MVCDYDASIRPDIVGDICHLEMLSDASYDGVFCCSILEHVYNPFAAVQEICRILRKGGAVFGYVPFLHTYHAKPGHYEDYYRFTEAGVKYLFKDFEQIETVAVRGNVTTLLHLLPGRLNKLQSLFYWVDTFFSNQQVSGFYFYGRK
jgi:SAM-dependent methyltransferase